MPKKKAVTKSPAPELVAVARAFVERFAAANGLDSEDVWRDRHQTLLEKGLDWFLNQKEKEDSLKNDYGQSLVPGRNSPPKYQWPGVETALAPEPTFLSFADYLARTTDAQRTARCRAAARKANGERLLSSSPEHRLSCDDVWNLIQLARGRCAYCGSLAVESRPSKANGAPVAWAHIGRRIGSLEHRHWRARGGGNRLENLAWCCLWCNTWESERRQGATDHGGFYPPPDEPIAPSPLRKERIVRPRPIHSEDDDEDDQDLYEWPYMSGNEPW